MLIKTMLLFLMAMMGLALWGRHRVNRVRGAFCTYCGKRNPCGCSKGRR